MSRLGLSLILSLLVHGALLGWLAARPDVGSGPSVNVLQVQVQTAPAAGAVPAPSPSAAEAGSTTDQPQRTALPAPSPKEVNTTTAAARARPPASASDASAGEPDPQWQQRLRQHLQARMQYPRAARVRRQQGVAELMFELDRRGQLLNLALASSTGFELLDREALALVTRAAPLPAPPGSMSGDSWQVKVPIRFELH